MEGRSEKRWVGRRREMVKERCVKDVGRMKG